MNRLGLGFFKLRFFITLAFSALLFADESKIASVYVWFIWAQVEYLLHMLNLGDRFISEWEEKLKDLIRAR